MEPRERVSGIRERDEACEIREKKRCIRNDRGRVVVMVSATQSESLVGDERTVKREIDDVGHHDAIFSVHSFAGENSDGGEDGKENAGEKREIKPPLRGNRQADKIFPLQQRTRANRSPRHESVGKIPRPANAFMLFANEWRKKLAAENPRESNKDISVRLGICWKNMSTDLKEKYFALAREVDAEHKRKYPDYVYNPKEARLRKAMREQSREQSRERSRRSILQSAIAIANARGTPITAAAVSASVTGGFLNQHRRFDCVPAGPVPSVGMPGSGMGAHRAQAEPPWFQAAHRPKPVHSPRIGDWYGGMDGDPIERLQAMGAMHHHHHHQRGLDKPPPVVKEQRNQECAATAFSSNGHSPDFAVAERELRRQETAADYTDFVDSQKWHPYQSSAGPHPHARSSHPSPQMGGILHPSVQNTNAHGHAHGPWGQFCHGVLPHVPTVTHSGAAIRGPRHVVFLRDRPPTRHCAFPEDASRMGYAPNKLDIDGIRASYPSPEHQIPRLVESAMDSVIDSTASMSRRDEDDGSRWSEPNDVATEMSSLDELVPACMPQEGAIAREKERESWHSSERFEPKRKPVSRQPLPGFHQAFGSTEIGKFSRSEFFVNMVGENSGSNSSGSAGNGDIGDADDGDVSRERQPLLGAAAAAATAAAAAAVVATTNASRTFDAEDRAFAVGNGAPYRGQPRTAPTWHSPHLIPEAHRLTTPILFPFPSTSRNVLGVNAIHGIVEDARLMPHVLPNECCWFARTGHTITRIPDGLMTCALLDYSHRSNEREWIRQKATVARVSMGHPVLLGGNRGEDYERIIGDRAQRNYVIVDEIGDPVGRERGSEAVNLKIERDQNVLVGKSAHESIEKKN